MEITISLSDEVGRELVARAQSEGLGVADFMMQIAQHEARKALPHESVSATNGKLTSQEWQIKAEKFRQSRAWLKAHRAKYAGQWVCLDGDRLISHGDNAQSVYAEADAQNLAAPLVKYIEKENLPFGGW